jgi:hypothetical protein
VPPPPPPPPQPQQQQQQHITIWAGDASAALTAAATLAHASSASWLFAAAAGDLMTVQGPGLVLQQLQELCESEKLLAWHSSLRDP